MKNRWGLLVIGLLVLGGLIWWGVTQSTGRRQLEVLVNRQTQRAFHELLVHVDNVEILLGKSLVVGSPRQGVTVLSDIWRQAYSAQADLNQLPIMQGTLMRTSKFLTQVGDFTYIVAKNAADGRPTKDDDWTKIRELRRQAGILNDELRSMQQQIATGRLRWSEIRWLADRDLRSVSKDLVDEGFRKIDKRMQEYPTLIYDGPFSDHVLQRTPKGLTGPAISVDKARSVALRFLPGRRGVDQATGREKDVNGLIPAYRLVVSAAEGTPVQNTTIDVSKKGGHIVWMLNPRSIGRERLSLDEAIARAREFLKSHGITDMVPTYATKVLGFAVIPFAWVQDGVLIYPDQIKVKVALDNGEIVGYEALGYLMSHRVRNLPEPGLGEDEARRMVNQRFRIESARLVVIPLENLNEALTYEFRGTLDGDTYLVYINAVTGREERILQVVRTREGSLTM